MTKQRAQTTHILSAQVDAWLRVLRNIAAPTRQEKRPGAAEGGQK